MPPGVPAAVKPSDRDGFGTEDPSSLQGQWKAAVDGRGHSQMAV